MSVGGETGFAGLTQCISPQFTVKVLQSLSPRDATAPAPAGGSPRPAPPTAREGGHRFAAFHYFRTQSQ